jgi:type I restriction enzyme S subunit
MAGGLIVGQTRPRISMGRLAELVVPYPPVELQRRFSVLVKFFDAALNNAETAAQNIERLFQTLLHRAFTGELTARWREAHMKELLAEMEQQAKALGLSSTAAHV